MIFFRFFDVRYIVLSYDIELERDRDPAQIHLLSRLKSSPHYSTASYSVRPVLYGKLSHFLYLNFRVVRHGHLYHGMASSRLLIRSN